MLSSYSWPRDDGAPHKQLDKDSAAMEAGDESQTMCATKNRYSTIMSVTSRALSWLAGLVLASGFVSFAHAADDPCSAYKWDVTEERAVFAQKAQSAAGGRDAPSALVMKTKTLYNLALAPQGSVKFVVPPGKKALADGAFAGVVHLRVPSPGAYRVSLNQGFWVDVVGHQHLIEATDFTGAHDCNAPRKIVQYNLPAGEDLVLQLSGAVKDHVLIAVTPAVVAAPGH
jgi:hypothetical protein